ncbi:MAG: carboxypeptidase-like regulatory domain-containing protein, partial [Bacteroidetes bacterium]|nr:carboxypeptidase-like regulatory domain-containing protein [Fibrella sp.]
MQPSIRLLRLLSVVLWVVLPGLPGPVLALNQDQLLKKPVRLTDTPAPRQLKDILNELKDRYSVDILYSDRLVQGLAVPGDALSATATLEQNLKAVLRETGLQFRKAKNGAYLITGHRAGRLLTSSSAVVPNTFSYAVGASPADAMEMAVAFSHSSPAQPQEVADETVTGRVTGETNEGLPGVSVLVKGTNRGTTTDATGNYRIAVPAPDRSDDPITLVFSFVGYVSQEMAVGKRNTVNISLQPDNKTLNEVVVVGYGQVKKSDLTGSVATVPVGEIRKLAVTSLDQQLQGRAAGVQITQNSGAPGGATTIRIRGGN